MVLNKKPNQIAHLRKIIYQVILRSLKLYFTVYKLKMLLITTCIKKMYIELFLLPVVIYSLYITTFVDISTKFKFVLCF